MIAKAQGEHALEDMDTGSQGVSGAFKVMLGTQGPDPIVERVQNLAFQTYPAPPTLFSNTPLTNPSPDPGIVQMLLTLSWRLDPKPWKLGLRLWRLVWPPQAKSLK